MSAIDQLQTAEAVLANERFAKTRKAAKTGVALLASFFVPFLGTIAFVATYPPFWNPKLAASVVSMGILATMALVLLIIVAWRPVRRLQQDIANGRVQERIGEVATMQQHGPLMRLTLTDEPGRPVTVDAALVDDRTRSQLHQGTRVRVRQLPQSGCLLSLAVETPTTVSAS